MASNPLERIKALISRASHTTTPLEEARTCALMAVQLISRHSYEVIDPVPKVEDDSDQWSETVATHESWTTEVYTFKLAISKSSGICVACAKPYNKGVPVAESYGKGTTHFKCKGYWIK